MSQYHTPVLLKESVDLLAVDPAGTYVDLTFGGGGHSRRILEKLGPGGRLYAFDQDRDTRANCPDDGRFHYVESNFRFLRGALRLREVEQVDGILADLGVSSHHFDAVERGFSFRGEAPLDMRMDRTATLTARDVVNDWPYEELRRILYDFGEERCAPAIARRIVQARQQVPIETTLQLVDIIKSAMPPAALREKQHPAKRSFQAIRIAVNGELDALPPMLEAAVSHLNAGGRLAVISFHSLEDRIIKKTMQELATGCTCPPNFPVCVCGKTPKIRLVSRKPIVSGDAELAENPRARSAKLRVAEKL